MSVRDLALCVCLGVIFVVVSCSKASKQVVELKRFPIDSMEGR
jgi:hypothetical protein